MTEALAFERVQLHWKRTTLQAELAKVEGEISNNELVDRLSRNRIRFALGSMPKKPMKEDENNNEELSPIRQFIKEINRPRQRK